MALASGFRTDFRESPYRMVFATGVFGVMALFILSNTLALAALLMLFPARKVAGVASCGHCRSETWTRDSHLGKHGGGYMVTRKQHLVASPQKTDNRAHLDQPQ